MLRIEEAMHDKRLAGRSEDPFSVPSHTFSCYGILVPLTLQFMY